MSNKMKFIGFIGIIIVLLIIDKYPYKTEDNVICLEADDFK